MQAHRGFPNEAQLGPVCLALAQSDHAQEALLEGLVSPPREAQSYEPAVVRTDPL